MPGKKTRQDGISTATKKWAIGGGRSIVATAIGVIDQQERSYQLPDIDGEPKGVDFSAAQVNGRDLKRFWYSAY